MTKHSSIAIIFFGVHASVFAVEIHPGIFIPPQIYRHDCQPQDNARRPSSTPYISGDTFRNMAKFFVDELRLPINPRDIKKGDIIFVVTELLGYFFTELHPRIDNNYILITHNSDLSAPGEYIHMLDDPKLIAWFAENSGIKYHPKLFPVPIGIANPYWPHGNIHILNTLRPQLQKIKKNKLVYLNIAQTNRSKREQVIQFFSNKSFCYISSPNKPWQDYLVDIAQSKFVLSPAGNGLDCHRTWETLLMGSIPIVLTSTLDSLYQDLPVLIINDWHEITEDFLIQKYQEMQAKPYNYEKIYANYWLNQIRECQQNI